MDFFGGAEKSSHWEENFIVHGNHNQTGKIPTRAQNDAHAMSIFTCNGLVELEDCSAWQPMVVRRRYSDLTRGRACHF
jgi:hypothetical protein